MPKKYPKGKPPKHATVRIPKKIGDAIEEFLETELAKKEGFLHKTDVVTEATRHFLINHGFYPIPESSLLPLEHFNLNGEGVLILDRTLQPNRIIQVYFRPEGVLCELCQSDKCRHVEFALDLPKVKEILHKKGWKIPAQELTDQEVKEILDELAKK